MSFDMESCFMVSSDIEPFFMPFLDVPSFDIPVVPDFMPELFIPLLMPGFHVVALSGWARAVLRECSAAHHGHRGRYQDLLHRLLRFIRSRRDNARREIGVPAKLLKLLENISCCNETNGGACRMAGAWNRPRPHVV
jgi:hypothetical protein